MGQGFLGSQAIKGPNSMLNTPTYSLPYINGNNDVRFSMIGRPVNKRLNNYLKISIQFDCFQAPRWKNLGRRASLINSM